MRALLLGWSSVLHGEATAGDVLATEAVARRLGELGIPHDTAWSPAMHLGYRPRGGVAFDDVDPAGYSHVIWVCGPVTGDAVREVHERFPDAERIAVGVSVLDPTDPAVTGFHALVPRDAPDREPSRDLAAAGVPRTPPLVGVYLTHGQGEYGDRRRHDAVSEALGRWLGDLDVARLSLDTRLDPRDWRLPATAEQALAIVSRLDVVLTTRLHGLVLALRSGVPAIAVDPVAGGGKVGAQARAWNWPAVIGAEDLLAAGGLIVLGEQLAWCLSGSGRAEARRCRDQSATAGADQLDALSALLARPGRGPAARS